MSFKKQRIILAFIFLLVGLCLGCLNWIFSEQVFYSIPHNSIADCWRLLWVAVFIPIGLCIRSFLWINYNSNPWKPFWSNYPGYMVYVSVSAVFIFILFHSILDLDNWLFYPMSALLIILLGMIPGKAMSYINGVLEYFSPKK